jgi:hypothetical protein
VKKPEVGGFIVDTMWHHIGRITKINPLQNKDFQVTVVNEFTLSYIYIFPASNLVYIPDNAEDLLDL